MSHVVQAKVVPGTDAGWPDAPLVLVVAVLDPVADQWAAYAADQSTADTFGAELDPSADWNHITEYSKQAILAAWTQRHGNKLYTKHGIALFPALNPERWRP